MKFSVITVCKNNIAGLKATYGSILEQTYRDYEWIVVDGNSSDGTLDWLKKKVGHTAKWISEPDSGIYNAMNKGLSWTSGEYVIFMNSGDRFATPDILEKVRLVISKEKLLPDFIYGDSVDITRENHQLYRKAKSYRKMWMGMFAQHQAMFFRRNKLGNLVYSEKFKSSGDYAFICEYLTLIIGSNSIHNIVRLNFPICIYSLGGVNEQYRLYALREDFVIRRIILHQSIFLSIVLFVSHFLHFNLKRLMPKAMRLIRYSNIKSNK